MGTEKLELTVMPTHILLANALVNLLFEHMYLGGRILIDTVDKRPENGHAVHYKRKCVDIVGTVGTETVRMRIPLKYSHSQSVLVTDMNAWLASLEKSGCTIGEVLDYLSEGQ